MKFTFCPHCGAKLVRREIGDEGLIPYCEHCSVPLWDIVTPSIITAVVNECREVALIRQDYVNTTNSICIAGVMQLGESAEEAVVREVKEEIGQDVEQVRYIRSWPYPSKEMLMLGFQSTVRKKELRLSSEVNAAEWVPYAEALSRMREGSVAWQLVKTVIEEDQRD